MELTLEQAVEWRATLWAAATQYALNRAQTVLPVNANVLEIGFNSGLMSCYLAQTFGWKITGYEISHEQIKKAQTNALQYLITDKVNFNYCPPEKTFEIPGEYDAIFLKSILYHNKSQENYKKWIHWLHSKLKPGGVLIAIENGQGHFLDRFYRNQLKNVSWKDNVFYSSAMEAEFKSTFKTTDIAYFGGFSQYLTAAPALCRAIMQIEKLFPHNADNCFIASIFAQK
jgi:cyclopropane fatty-acyl-phospholipid synthase-like methyltransferase